MNNQHFGSGPREDPDSTGCVDPDREYGSGSGSNKVKIPPSPPKKRREREEILSF
jgi:hypothetical protein